MSTFFESSIRMRKLLLILILVLVFCQLGGLSARADWETVNMGGETYITFRSFCKFYDMSPAPVGSSERFEISGKYGRLRFKADSREAFINGVKYWLGSAVVMRSDGQLLLPKVDLIKTIEPVLRPDHIDKTIVRGVIIDPGHGGSDNGAVARTGLMEKNLALNTALRLGKILKKNQLKVIFTRTSDSFPSLVQRAQYTERYPGYIFVSVHYNQGTSISKGVETFCLTPRFAASTADEGHMRSRDKYSQTGNTNDEKNILLASCIHSEIIKLHPLDSDRGVKRARFAVLRRALTPAVLVEGGFVSNTNGDLRLLASPTYREALAQRIAQGILNYIGIMNGTPTLPQPEKPKETSALDYLFRAKENKPTQLQASAKPSTPIPSISTLSNSSAPSTLSKSSSNNSPPAIITSTQIASSTASLMIQESEQVLQPHAKKAAVDLNPQKSDSASSNSSNSNIKTSNNSADNRNSSNQVQASPAIALREQINIANKSRSIQESYPEHQSIPHHEMHEDDESEAESTHTASEVNSTPEAMPLPYERSGL